VMADFKERVQVIEGLTHAFINTSFQKLRSSEGAFDLLQNFRDIQSRESINRQMMEKYLDILHVYRRELEELVGLWERHKDAPPVFKNFPPTAGAIAWARALYNRAKRPIVKFRTMPDLLHSEIGRQVKEQYLDFARAVVAWEKAQHSAWEERVSAVAHEHLKKPILTADADATDDATASKLVSPDTAHNSTEAGATVKLVFSGATPTKVVTPAAVAARATTRRSARAAA